jgi:hypothetical protein
MTLSRSLTAVLFAGICGCAAIPAVTDDIAPCDACTPPPFEGGTVDGFPTGGDGGVEAAAPAPRATLCGNTCDPDDSCKTLGDGGLPVSDASVLACRVITSEKASCVAPGTGGNGASCTSGADCETGYECIGSAGGGTCRHYCCNDMACVSMTNASTTGEAFFCDIAVEKSAPLVNVPVCNVIQPCQPLMSNTCSSGQACTIVEVNNGTEFKATCDTVGKGVLGDDCETSQCAAGFACIGPSGARTCQQLCDSQNPCPGSLNCNTKSQTFGVGICSAY